MADETQQQVAQFKMGRQQLLNVGNQKQQLQVQSNTLGSALDELKETKQKTVFKAVGNILIEKEVSKVKKELQDAKESVDLRIKTLQKQEDSLVNKLNKIRSKIEETAGESAEEKPKKKKKK